jgi:vancomycin aglycone glucosyltransferase
VKVLLSSIGTRGECQPILALALELRSFGQDARLCAAPNFKDWVESFGIEFRPIGPDLRQFMSRPAPKPATPLSEGERRQLAVHAVRSQFPVLMEAARGCDLVVAAGPLQITTRSVTESLRIPYVFASYCPTVLPSPDHPPPKIGTHHPQTLSASTNASLWKEEERSWNELFGDTLNEERSKAGLSPIVESVQRHIFTDRPWLAADSTLAPAAPGRAMQILQTGAWLLRDPAPLPHHVEEFLESGAPPVYFGFGSMRASENTAQVLIETARALGLRSILSRGWADLKPMDGAADCLSVGDVAHERLFPRVAAIVHHGGAGTTTAAARAGKPQVIVPHMYDQYYWAHRIQQLGIGIAGAPREELTVPALVTALRASMRPETARRAESEACRIEPNGARIAAQRLVEEFAS